jgi:hypothetical protein
MLEKIIETTSQAIERYFTPVLVEQAAREYKFVQRKSTLGGEVFLKTLVLGFIQHPRASLNQLCQDCLDLGISITPQGLDQRINTTAVQFLKRMLERALTLWRTERQDIAQVVNQFTAVYFQDSSVIALPEALQDVFPGVGGNASSAAVKLQLLFEFLSGNIAHLAFVAGRLADQGYQGHLPHILPGSLLIQDLGFFNLGTLVSVVQQLAFFLTRWQNQTTIYLASAPEQTIDMLALLRAQEKPAAEYQVLVGKCEHLACRMICARLPPSVADERRRRARAAAKRRGATPAQRTLDLMDWNVFLTNTPAEMLSLRQVLVCYSLRWQIELVFKLWKSEAALKHLRGIRRERVLCELYAKMIGIVLTHFLVAPLRFLLCDQHVEISPTKARQTLQDCVKRIGMAIGQNHQHLKDELLCLYQRILRFGRKTKRKKRLSTFDKLCAANELALCQLFPLA